MKKSVVHVAVDGWGKGTAPGWATDVPGLVCAQLELNPDNKKKVWLLFHEDSGLRVRSCAKRSECNELAVAIGDLVDWTKPVRWINGAPIRLDIARIHHELLATEAAGPARADDGGTPSEGTAT